MNRPTPDPTRPWYREPMVWLVLALPAAAVIGSLATVLISLRADGADAAPAEVRRCVQVPAAAPGAATTPPRTDACRTP